MVVANLHRKNIKECIRNLLESVILKLEWYEHEPKSVLENKDYKILRDFSIQTKYWKLQKIWNVRVKIIPLVVGSLGAISKQFGNGLKEIGITAEIGQVQKTATGLEPTTF